MTEYRNLGDPRNPPLKVGDRVFLAKANDSDKTDAKLALVVKSITPRPVGKDPVISVGYPDANWSYYRDITIKNFVREVEESPLDNVSDTSGNDNWAQEILAKGIVDALCSLGVYIRSANWHNVEVTPPFNVYEGEVVFTEEEDGEEVPVVYTMTITRTRSYSINGATHYDVEATLVENRKL